MVPRRSLLDTLVREASNATAGDGAGLAPTRDTELELTGVGGNLTSHFAVEEVAVASVAAALLAAAALHRQRGGSWTTVGVDLDHVAAAMRSERHFRVGAELAGAGFAPLSRFWRTADGWIRTHANYPWHEAALLRAVGSSSDAGSVADAVATSSAFDLETRIVSEGGVAAAVRTLGEWEGHPQGAAVSGEPLVSHEVLGEAAPRARPASGLPAGGVRVLDLTRVIAGPVCTRYLGALGAEVLRIDPPSRPDLRAGTFADTLVGKRSAFMELGDPRTSSAFGELIEEADVVVHGYRPGSLDDYGLGAEDLSRAHPGLVVVYLDAWGHSGPWAGRRGFDSIVQAASGIAIGESPDGPTPGALPCQLLDHATGYLAAAAVLHGLRLQAMDGGTHAKRLSLARTASWLTSVRPSPASCPPAEPATAGRAGSEFVVQLSDARGSVSLVAPPGSASGHPLAWPPLIARYGEAPPIWSR